MPLLKLNATTSQRRWFSILQFMASIVKQNIVAMICQQSGLLLDEPRKSMSFQNLLCISFVKKIKSSIYFNVRFKGFVLLSFAKPTQLSFSPIAKQLTLKAPFVHKNDYIISRGIWISFFIAERFPILTWRFANSHFIHLPSYQNIFNFRPHHIQSLSKSIEPPLVETLLTNKMFRCSDLCGTQLGR